MVDVDAPAPVPITSSTDVDAGIDALSATLSSTHLDNPDHGQRQVPASPPNRSPSPSAPPSLVSDPALSGSSSTSIASLSSSGDASSPPTSAGEAGVGGMDNAHAAPGHGRGHGRHPYGDGADDAVTRYKVGLYAYTRDLYLQAQQSNSRAEKRRESVSGYNTFGAKQSGMERLAAKKALARRLNA
ncbi:hypothetical protein EHS25_000565 [Saitozyma podzolica]|uniref:Uncharacterized protein n=1 Tax=Saitozyma podzolica TaxID=1890683 RepID=A0A427YWG4_9TREE|nr:hypothetical protein EHS25_000565 [Saitozyma podzolica]